MMYDHHILIRDVEYEIEKNNTNYSKETNEGYYQKNPNEKRCG